ncbi:hypothetical protein V5799_007312 [Amblyomma americanum]|uniref:Uncharacterized protein n=1 Tax=Amblyomma americanum TaxID=6943 RepID=A0AAQ4DTV9_AMBAM
MPRSAGFEQTRSKAKSRSSGIKVIESGGISSDTTTASTGGRRRGLLALPLPTKVYGPASGNRDPLPMTSAAVAEQVRALRMEAAPGIRVLVGLRSLDVENSYLRLWASRSGLVSSANLAYEWLRRTGLDGIALTNLVVGRHTVDVYVQFLKQLRVLFREDYLIVFGFLHRESHEHDDAYTEAALRTISRY